MSNKYLLISDTNNENLKLENCTFLDCSETELHEIAEEIEKKNNIGAIFINIEAKVNGSNRSDLKAIELIYWLRLKYKFLGTIITYGFLSSAQVLRLKPEYIVLHAPGNYHFRLPDEMSKIKDYLVLPKISSIDDYKMYLQSYAYENKLRHSDANKWALRKLALLVNLIDNNETRCYLDDSIYKTENVEQLISEIIYKHEILEGSEDLNNEIKNNYEKLNTTQKKILLIDDMASMGWSKLLKKFLNCQDDEFKTLENIDNLSIPEISEQAIKDIENDSINLILLDLRLKNEIGTSHDLDSISGVQVLKKIKEKRPDIPILIISATNKLITLRKLKEMGVWDIWTKEGQDNQITNIDLRLSLLDLLKKVNNVYAMLSDSADRCLYEIEYRLKTKTYSLTNDDINNLPINVTQNRKHPFSDFDICIVDTNIWISSRSKEEEFVKKQILIQILSDYFSGEGKEFIIHNHTLSELRKKAKPIFDDNNDLMVKTANFSLNKIIELARLNKLSIANYDLHTYDSHAYADPRIIDYCLDQLLGNTPTEIKNNDRTYTQIQSIKENAKSILLITDDRGLTLKAQCLKNKYKNKKYLVTRNSSQLFKNDLKITL